MKIELDASSRHALTEVIDTCHSISLSHGFWQHAFIDHPGRRADDSGILNPSIVGEKLALIHSEVSEALEVARTSGGLGIVEMREELADVVIRVFDLATFLGGAEEFADALIAKIDKNQHREHLHGKAF